MPTKIADFVRAVDPEATILLFGAGSLYSYLSSEKNNTRLALVNELLRKKLGG